MKRLYGYILLVGCALIGCTLGGTAGLLLPIEAALARQAPPPIVVRSDGTIDAAAYGMLPGQDCTAALQRLLGSECPTGATVQLGTGNYKLSATVDAFTGSKLATHVDHLYLKGSGGTTISGSFAGPLVAYNAGPRFVADASAVVKVSGITFTNGHQDGIGLQIERTDRCTIKDCAFSGGNGLVIGKVQNSNYEVTVEDCDFNGDLKTYPNAVGCAINGNGLMSNVKATGWKLGFGLCRGMSINRGRIENCGKGLRLGTKPDGTTIETTACVFTSLYTEATAFPVQIGKSCYYNKFSGLRIFGSGNTVTGEQPTYGLAHEAGAGPLTLESATIGGSFSTAAVSMRGDGPVVLINADAAIKNATGVAWDVTTTKITKIQSNCP